MPKSNSVLRALAVVSSVSLFAGYVLYRGGLISLPAAVEAQVVAESAPTTQQTIQGGTLTLLVPPAGEVPRTFILSSKSGAVVDPVRVPTAQTPSTSPRVLLPGSKSNTHITGGQSVIFGDGHVDWTGAAPSTAPSTQPRILLPGSKSFLPAP